MAIIRCINLTKTFGLNEILSNINFVVEQGDRIGIVGNNGSGKSTLLRIIAGRLDYDSGNITIDPELTIGYLEQNTVITSEYTLWEEMISEHEDIRALENQLKSIENKISELGSRGEIDNNLFDIYERLRTEYEDKNGYAYESTIRKTLDGLGFTKYDYERPVSEFSGGQKNKIALAKILQKKPDILLLDEPTNYLDIPSCEWLEDYLKSYAGSVIVVSHDRYFLNGFVNKIFDIHDNTLDMYNGNYDVFIKIREENRRQLEKDYIIQKREIDRIINLINVQRNRGTEKSIKVASSREKMLEKIKLIEKPKVQPRMRLDFRFQSDPSNIVVKASNISMVYDENSIFRQINITISKGEKVALIGPNGSGKTTLLRIIAGDLKPSEGEINYGNRINIGYLSQERTDLNFENTLVDEIWSADPSLKQLEVRNLLSYFLFVGDDVFKKVNTLSGGELIRLSFAKLVVSEANLLLLDEPTNHLDIPSKEVIEDAIGKFKGTVLFVSHDRYFINKLADRILEMQDGKVTEYLGNYSYYIEKKNRLNDSESQITHVVSKTERANMFRKEREKLNERKAARQRLKDLENIIEAAESEIKELEVKLGDPSLYSDDSAAKETVQRYNRLKEDLDVYYNQWVELMGSLD